MKTLRFTVLFLFLTNLAFSFDASDEKAINKAISNYVYSWNFRGSKGFADDFAEDADFVNIFGMNFSGKKEIEGRHIQITKGFLKGSTLEVVHTKLREVQPGLVIAIIRWTLSGYRNPKSDPNVMSNEVREGIISNVFVKEGKKWIITAFHNTMTPN